METKKWTKETLSTVLKVYQNVQNLKKKLKAITVREINFKNTTVQFMETLLPNGY